MKYNFKHIDQCLMCSSDVKSHRILGKRLNKNQGFNPTRKIGITTTITQCKNCGLILPNPLPIPSNIQDHYGKMPQSYWNEQYFEVSDSYFQTELDTYFKLSSEQPNLKSLDIGAGIGKQMIGLKKAGFESYGIEPGSEFYDYAINKTGIKSTHLSNCKLEDANFKNDFFDFISFGAVLEHLYDPDASIKKALEWITPIGLIHIEVPNSNWLISRLVNFLYKVRGMDYVTNLSPMHSPYHLYEFTLKSFQLHGIINGYEVVHHNFYVGKTFMPKPLDYIFKRIMKKSNTGMQLVVWLRKK